MICGTEVSFIQLAHVFRHSAGHELVKVACLVCFLRDVCFAALA